MTCAGCPSRRWPKNWKIIGESLLNPARVGGMAGIGVSFISMKESLARFEGAERREFLRAEPLTGRART